MNYDLLMKEEINKFNGKVPTLLLHACCAPCSSACLKRLGDHFKITMFYYNPNITLEEEYKKRLNELKKFISEFKTKYEIEILDAKYDPQNFIKLTKGMEDMPERSKRCYLCYEMRLKETIKRAYEEGFDYVATTLTLSPYKNADWLNEIGLRLAEGKKVKYLITDFKKKMDIKKV